MKIWINIKKINVDDVPGPALAICSPISKSFATGLPGKTLDNCDTVLLTVEYNLLITSIVQIPTEICTDNFFCFEDFFFAQVFLSRCVNSIVLNHNFFA